jgi:hypothetical protein
VLTPPGVYMQKTPGPTPYTPSQVLGLVFQGLPVPGHGVPDLYIIAQSSLIRLVDVLVSVLHDPEIRHVSEGEVHPSTAFRAVQVSLDHLVGLGVGEVGVPRLLLSAFQVLHQDTGSVRPAIHRDPVDLDAVPAALPALHGTGNGAVVLRKPLGDLVVGIVHPARRGRGEENQPM